MLERFLGSAWRGALAAAGLVAALLLAVSLSANFLHADPGSETRGVLLAFPPVLLALPFPKGSSAICGNTLRASGGTIHAMHVFVWAQWQFRILATALAVLYFDLAAVWVLSLLLWEEFLKFPSFTTACFAATGSGRSSRHEARSGQLKSAAPRETRMLKTQLRRAIDPRHAKAMDTTELRAEFLIDDLFQPDAVHLAYTQYDRMIVGGAVPAGGPLTIDKVAETGTPSWLDRREAVLVNLGAAGTVEAKGETHALGRCDMLYLGMGSGPVTVAGKGARFYIVSAPAHRAIPARRITIGDAAQVPLGSRDTSNERVVYQFVHPAVMESCQIVMGMTRLANGSVWNTMPAHRHERRSEAYLYLDLPEDQSVVHLMGEPAETRHLIVRNEQAVLSPPWSIHCGAGTSSYSFIWAMAGDNVDYTDVDKVAMEELG